MKGQRRAVLGAVPYAVVLTLSFVPAAQAGQCLTRDMRVTFYTCGEGFSHCLTKQGHQPIPFRTVAVGDRSLLGRWLYIEDLGGWVLAADTGAALKKNWIDVFIGERRMAGQARRLGVQHWTVRICSPDSASPESAGAADPPRRTIASAAAVR